MPDLQALLERIEWLDAELKQPVAHDQISFAERIEREDELAHLGMTVLPQLAKAVKTVLETHRPLADGSCDTCEGAWLYPCPTVRAITEALGADQ